MLPDSWNQRFESEDFVYGTTPNAFVAEQVRARALPAGATVADLGAGEGRNAVWMAQQGFRVTAVDFSRVALEKARHFAQENGVAVETKLRDLTTWEPSWEGSPTFDLVVVSFVHLGPEHRRRFYDLAKGLVRPGGTLVGEWFRPEQLLDGYVSGGPEDLERLIPPEELERLFADGASVSVEPVEATLDEGFGHQGPAAVVRLVWTKPG